MLGNVYGPLRALNIQTNYQTYYNTYLLYAAPVTDNDIGFRLTPNQDLGLKVAGPVGNLFGQIIFGWLADHVGRKRMCMSNNFITYHLNTNAIFRRR
jgi:MFS family permease